MKIVTKHSEGQREYLFKISDKDHGYNSPVYYWNDGAATPHWQKLWVGHGYQQLLASELGYDPMAKRCFHCKECEITNRNDDVELLYEDICNKLLVRMNACEDHCDAYCMEKNYTDL